MNGCGFLLCLASVIAVVSFALLMCLVGRIGTRTLVMILVADSVAWAMAAFFWWARLGV